MNKLLKISMALLLLCFSISNVNSQSVSGTWTFNSGNMPLTMVLFDNGTGEFQGLPVKYSLQNGRITIDDGSLPVTYNYQVTATTLTLTGGNLPSALVFTRPGSSASPSASPAQQTMQSNPYQPAPAQSQGGMATMAGNKPAQSGGGSVLNGVWEGQQGKVIFYPDGYLIYNGTAYQYSPSGNSITITGTDGSTSFNYSITNNQLTLSQNSNSAIYNKTSDLKAERVDPQIVGKWCIMSSNYNSYSGGGSSSEECITLNADGTYSYSYSAERSGYAANQSAYGGTANQNSDRGTWKTDGLTLVSYSQTTGKTSRYTLTKENAQNGDATIVVAGRKFVTAYNRPGF
jgi:hypothetical protein